MCHRSEAADHSIKDLTGVYEVGDLVKAVILKVSCLPFSMIDGRWTGDEYSRLTHPL